MTTTETPGVMLRRLRVQRNLTLRSAADRLDVSASALSRLERDVRAVNRHDIEAFVRSYQLTHWEASQLLQCAGFTARLPGATEGQADWGFISDLLRSIHFPAILTDDYGYLIAWNGVIHALWRMPARPAGPIHILDSLFSALGRRELGDSWHDAAVATCWRFYVKTLRVSGGTRFQKIMQNLAELYGNDFESVWNEALTNGYAGRDSTVSSQGTVLRLQTQVGVVEYLSLQTMVNAPLPLELTVHIPIGEPSTDHHRRLLEGIDMSRVVRCPRRALLVSDS